MRSGREVASHTTSRDEREEGELAAVELVGLSKAYSGAVAVSRVSLKIASGEFFSLLGPSGCGKSTTLRMVAGFVTPDEGQILIDGDDIVDRPPEKRDIGIVFQNYAIFPHMSVAENIAFGLRMRKVDRETIERRVRDALHQVGLDKYEGRYQRQLSGGEQQRVALARVLVTRPRILLLDEPLSALDKNLREEMKYWIKGLQRSLGITTIYVTHDQSEALTMSDRIGVMNKARVVQIGSPVEIYERPSRHLRHDIHRPFESSGRDSRAVDRRRGQARGGRRGVDRRSAAEGPGAGPAGQARHPARERPARR